MQDYLCPRTLDEALAALAEGPATIAAGCTDLFPATDRQNLAGRVVDLSGVETLHGVDLTSDGLRIGAMASWSDILRKPLPPSCDMLKQAAREVGSIQIQNAATVVGNLCNASPAADGVPCLLALEAGVELASVQGTRRLALADFITGVRRTARQEDELAVALHIPATALAGTSRFLKLGARRHLVISIAMVAVRLVVEEGRIADAAVAVGACSPVGQRLSAVEAQLRGTAPANAVHCIGNDAVGAALDPITDVRADASYRRDAAAELLRRAVAELCAPAAGAAA